MRGLGQHERGDGRNGAKVEWTGQHGAGTLHRLHEGMGIVQQGRGAGECDFTGMGEAGAAGFPLGQFHAQQILQFADPGRQGGLGHVAGLGRA